MYLQVFKREYRREGEIAVCSNRRRVNKKCVENGGAISFPLSHSLSLSHSLKDCNCDRLLRPKHRFVFVPGAHCYV